MRQPCRQFPLSLIRQVIAQPEADLYRLLASLQRKEFLYEQPAFPESEYIFKHALTQEVAYGTVLQEQRKALHEHTAQAIEALYRTTVDDHYGELAHHFSRSGNTAKAIEYLQLAGQQAVQRSANAEAISHLTAARDLLMTRPETPERDRQELLLLLILGVPLLITRGSSSQETGKTYLRAWELGQKVGETHQHFPALFGLRTFHQVRGEFRTAREFGEQLLSLARQEQDPVLLMEALRALGCTLFHLGEFSEAQVYIAQGLTLYDDQRRRSRVFFHGIEPGVFGRSYMAWTLWSLGYPDQAIQKSKDAHTLAQELSESVSVAFAQVYAAMGHQFRGDAALAQEWAEAGIALAREQGFLDPLGQGTVLQGWLRAEQGQCEEGIAEIRQGIAAYQAMGAGIFRSYHLVLLAEAQGKAGRADEGLAALAEALAVAEKNGERFYEAEVWRIYGELALQRDETEKRRRGETEQKTENVSLPDSPILRFSGSVAEFPVFSPEEAFLKAIEIAQKQQAKSLEFRAVMSLARLWQSQGKTAEARQMLAEIYGWFTEGFDTKDLQEAKALLDGLEGKKSKKRRQRKTREAR